MTNKNFNYKGAGIAGSFFIFKKKWLARFLPIVIGSTEYLKKARVALHI